MNRVAALAAVSLLAVLTACTPERPMSEAAIQQSGGERDLVVPAAGDPVTASLRPQIAPDGSVAIEVRDAKEAAEQAARKIFDATLSAATRLREVGVDAVQAVQSGLATNGDQVAEAQAAKSGQPEAAKN